MKALEIFIGLFFVYLVLSTLVTSISDILIARFHLKAKVLRQTVDRLFFKNSTLTKQFFNQPKILALIDPARQCKNATDPQGSGTQEESAQKKSNSENHAPSSLNAKTFATVLMQLISKEPCYSLGGFNHAVKRWANSESLKDKDEKDQRVQLAHAIESQIEHAAVIKRQNPQLSERDALIQSLGNWYDESMDRSRGIFKRLVQRYVIISSIAVTVLINADTIRIINALSTNDEILKASVEAAYKEIGTEGDDSSEQANNFKEAFNNVEDTVLELENTGVPLGWDDYEFKKMDFGCIKDDFGQVAHYWFLKIIGLSATIIAASLGAPFWYDILNKISKIRATVSGVTEKKEADSSENPTKTANQQGPQPAHTNTPKTFAEAMASDEDTFDINIAYWTARCSKIAYLPFPEIEPEVSKMGVSKKPILLGSEGADNASRGTQGFIINTHDSITICFRGTQKEELQDIITDLNIPLDSWNILGDTPGPTVSVHKGFLSAYSAVKETVVAQVKEALEENPEREIWLTGHSLGAGLATLCAADLCAQKIPVSGLYTYGSPRPGDKDFATFLMEEMSGQIFRFVNEDDPITEVPPEIFQHYSHVGKIRYLDKFGRIKADRASWNRVLRKAGFWADLLNPDTNLEQITEEFKVEIARRAAYHSDLVYLDKISAHSGHNYTFPA
ncbi:MAG: lipase family protein [Opitutales bacterium]